MYQVEFKLFDFAFRFSPVAFTVFGKDVFWYGIIITVGIILAVMYAFMRAKQSGIKPDHMYDYSIFTIIFGIIGARTYYVLSELDSYNSFMDAIAIWNGGLGIYGAIIVTAIVVYFFCKKRKGDILSAFDMVSMSYLLAQGITLILSATLYIRDRGRVIRNEE